MKKYLSLIILLCIAGCDQNEKIVEQAKFIQKSVVTFTDACTGKLSMSMEITGVRERPVTIKMTCDEMNKKHDYFKAINAKDAEDFKKDLEKMN